MIHIAELFAGLMEKDWDVPEVQQGMVRVAWSYCVGEAIRAVTEPVEFRNGILRVIVKDSQWKRTLVTMKSDLLARLNQYLKKPVVKELELEVQLQP